MSAGLLFLESDEFQIKPSVKGDVLGHQIPGFSLILFYSTYCSNCQVLLPIFKKLPGTLSGCQFGIINVSQNRRCVEMSQRTITPIKYVPYIVFYINGMPYVTYKSENPSEDEIRQFVKEMAGSVQKKLQFSENRVKENKDDGIPEYTIGKPLRGNDKVCYLEFNNAYTKN